MKKITSYSQFRSKALAVFMAALMSSFSLTPLALADEVAPDAGTETVVVTQETSADEGVPNGEIVDGKIRLKVSLPSKSFVYDGEAHSIFDEETHHATDGNSQAQPAGEGQEATDESVNTPETSDELSDETSDETAQNVDGTHEAQGSDQVKVEPENGAVDQTVPQESTDAATSSALEGETPEDDVQSEGANNSESSQNEADNSQSLSDEAADVTSDADKNASEANITDASTPNATTETTAGETPADKAPVYPILSMESPEELHFTYDGETYTVTGLTITEVVATEIGSVAYEANGTPRIANSEGTDVSDMFALEILPGNLIIEQRNLILVSDSLFKTYEPGAPLVDESGKIAVEGDGFLAGDSAQYTFTGSQEEIGASLNTFTYEFDEGTDADVYNVVEKPGTLYVTAFDFDGVIPMTIATETETIPYDGQEHYLIDYATSTFSLDGDEAQFTVEAANEDAPIATGIGEYSFAPEGPFTVTDTFGNDVSAWFAITWEPTTLTIEPRAMYLKVNDHTKFYGEEDPAFTYQFVATDSENDYVDTLADADDLGEITLTREEGEDVGEYAIIANYEENPNYNVTAEDGMLSIAAAKIEVDVESVNVVYDGEPHSVTVNCDLPDVTVLYKTPESEWSEENPSYTEIGTYPVYVQILPTENNTGNTASDVIEAQVVISSDDPAENPDEGKDDTLDDDASNATTDEPQGPASPAEDPDYAEPPAQPHTPSDIPDASNAATVDNLSEVDTNVNDLTLPETATTDVPSNDLSVPENELAEDEAPNSELLATTSSDNAVGANNASKTQKSETVPMTVNESSSNPFGGIFGIIAVGIIVLALCGIGAAIYLWRTKEADE